MKLTSGISIRVTKKPGDVNRKENGDIDIIFTETYPLSNGTNIPKLGFGTRFIEGNRAGIKHWHGAKKDSWFSHLAVECPGAKCHNEWCEPVVDDHYRNL